MTKGKKKLPESTMAQPATEEGLPIEKYEECSTLKKLGNFLVIKAPNIPGQRYNIDRLRIYGKAGEKTVSLVWDNGLPTKLNFDTIEKADAVIEDLDNRCLQ